MRMSVGLQVWRGVLRHELPEASKPPCWGSRSRQHACGFQRRCDWLLSYLLPMSISFMPFLTPAAVSVASSGLILPPMSSFCISGGI